jgi:hypothetical protein
MQKQSLYWIVDFKSNQTWRINYYPLSDIDENGILSYIYICIL